MAFTTAILLSGTATAINVGSVMHDKRDPYPAVIAGGIVLVTLSFLSQWQDSLAIALAGCFLVGTILLRGETFFAWLSALVSAK